MLLNNVWAEALEGNENLFADGIYTAEGVKVFRV